MPAPAATKAAVRSTGIDFAWTRLEALVAHPATTRTPWRVRDSVRSSASGTLELMTAVCPRPTRPGAPTTGPAGPGVSPDLLKATSRSRRAPLPSKGSGSGAVRWADGDEH